MPLSYGAFIYPDLRTTIIGRFSPSSSSAPPRLLLLEAGKATSIESVADYGSLKRIAFGEPDFTEASPLERRLNEDSVVSSGWPMLSGEGDVMAAAALASFHALCAPPPRSALTRTTLPPLLVPSSSF